MIRKLFGMLLLLSAMGASAMANIDYEVPEVDPGFLGASVALLIGGALLFGQPKKK